MSYAIFLFFLFGVPVAVLLWFIISLVLFLQRDRADAAQCSRRKLSLMLSAIVIGVMVAAVVALMILISLAVAHV